MERAELEGHCQNIYAMPVCVSWGLWIAIRRCGEHRWMEWQSILRKMRPGRPFAMWSSHRSRLLRRSDGVYRR